MGSLIVRTTRWHRRSSTSMPNTVPCSGPFKMASVKVLCGARVQGNCRGLGCRVLRAQF